MKKSTRLMLTESEYTVPEFLEEVSRHYRISLDEEEMKNSLDRAIRLDISKKRLNIKPSSNPSPRKTKYSRFDMQRIADKRIEYFIAKSYEQYHSGHDEDKKNEKQLMAEKVKALKRGIDTDYSSYKSAVESPDYWKMRVLEDALDGGSEEDWENALSLFSLAEIESFITEREIAQEVERVIDLSIKNYILTHLIELDTEAIKHDVLTNFYRSSPEIEGKAKLWEKEAAERLRALKYYKARKEVKE